MDMPPLTPPDKPLNPVFWRLLLVLACVLVFSFALHAKVAVYGHTTQPHPTTSSKLWMNDVRLDGPTAAPSFVAMWLAMIVASLLLASPVGRLQAAPAVMVHELGCRQYLHRFLRPPPTR
jgi:hypothetical protein